MALQAGQAYVDLVPRLDAGFAARAGAMVEAATAPVIARVSQAFTDAGEKLRTVGARMSMFVTLPILAAAGASFKLASDLNEARSMAQVVFDDMAKDVLAWSKTSAKAFGMSRAEALQSSSTLGAMFRAMDLGTPIAAKMSKTMLQLAGDLGSAYNQDPSAAFEALRSGLVGETEPLRRFGVTLSQARIEAKALELGLWDGVEPISAGAKAQAAYALIMQDTALIQGNYALTADDAANKQRTLTAELKDLGAEIGARLLPIGKRLLGWVGRLLEGWDRLGPVGQDLVLKFGLVAAAAGPVVYIVGALATVIGFLTGTVGAVVVVLAALAVGIYFLWTNWDTVWTWILNHKGYAAIIAIFLPFIASIVAIVGAVKYVYDHWSTIWPEIQRITAEVLAWLDKNVGPVVDRLVKAFTVGLGIVAAVVGAGVAVILWIWDNFGAYIIQALEMAWDFVVGIVEAALQVVRGILDVFIGIFTLDWDTFWSGVKEIVAGVWDAVVAVVSYAIGLVFTVIEAGLALIGIAWDTAWAAVSAVLGAVWATITSVVSRGVDTVVGFVRELPGRILGFVADLLGAGASLGKAFLDGFVNTITGAVGFAGDVARAILNAFKGAWNAAARRINDLIPDKIAIRFAPDIDLPDDPIPVFQMHQGGIVPGALGMERLVLAQAGERIIPIGAGRAETADRALFGDVNIYGVQDKRGVADELAWLAITNGSV